MGASRDNEGRYRGMAQKKEKCVEKGYILFWPEWKQRNQIVFQEKMLHVQK